jgi:RNA polymerase sigma-70 factor (ECF subfamily)
MLDCAVTDSDALHSHRRALFGLAYRMLGTASDAEDVVQETFTRALDGGGPSDPTAMRPWLLRVATRLAIDALRRRRRDGYVGPWLPSPVPTDELVVDGDAGDRYAMLESVSFAWLVALEALAPTLRATFLLSEIFGLSGPEVAAATGTTEGNVRIRLHRARRALAAFDRSRLPRGPEAIARARRALERLGAALASRDQAAVEALFTDDVTAIHDGGGERFAAGRVITGPEAVAAVHLRLAELTGPPVWLEAREVNGTFAVVVRYTPRGPRYPEEALVAVDVAEDGRISALYSVVALLLRRGRTRRRRVRLDRRRRRRERTMAEGDRAEARDQRERRRDRQQRRTRRDPRGREELERARRRARALAPVGLNERVHQATKARWRLATGDRRLEDLPRGIEVALDARVAEELLGRHEAGRADHRRLDAGLADAPRGAEVDELHRRVRGDEDVLGLEVAVDPATPVDFV